MAVHRRRAGLADARAVAGGDALERRRYLPCRREPAHRRNRHPLGRGLGFPRNRPDPLRGRRNLLVHRRSACLGPLCFRNPRRPGGALACPRRHRHRSEALDGRRYELHRGARRGRRLDPRSRSTPRRNALRVGPGRPLQERRPRELVGDDGRVAPPHLRHLRSRDDGRDGLRKNRGAPLRDDPGAGRPQPDGSGARSSFSRRGEDIRGAARLRRSAPPAGSPRRSRSIRSTTLESSSGGTLSPFRRTLEKPGERCPEKWPE